MLRLAPRSTHDLSDTALKVLVVDDDSGHLEGLRRALHRDRARWDITYCTDASTPTKLLKKRNIDVVISGLATGGDDGDLLAVARDLSPATARIRLAAGGDDQLLQSARVAHQVLDVASDMQVVRTAIERLAQSRGELPEEHLRALVNDVEVLPTPSDTQRQLSEVMSRPDHDLTDVAEVVETDVALTAELVRLVNSSYFGLRKQVEGVREAVGMLGLDLVEATVASRSAFANADKLPIDAAKVNRHSQLVAAVSGFVAAAGGGSKTDRSLAVSVGLLHDIGVLILAQVAPKGADSAAQVLAFEDTDAERLAFGADRFAIGAHLLDLWAFSPRVPETIRELNRPTREIGAGTVAWSVRVAHHAIMEHGVGLPSGDDDRPWFENIEDIERELLLSD